MLFKIRSVSVFNDCYEDIIKAYPQLNGYKIKKYQIYKEPKYKHIKGMLININSLKELEKLGKELNQELIIDMVDKKIMIYDDVLY